MPDREPGESGLHRPAELQHQLDQIGVRFLDRVLGELDSIEAVLIELRSGTASAAGTLEMFAHRIRGSSAIFGFAGLSAAAGTLETLLLSMRTPGAAVPVAEEITEQVAAVRAAAQTARAGRASP